MTTKSEMRAQLVLDMASGDGLRMIEAAKSLLIMGEYGDPKGIFCLTGAKEALGKWRITDAVILTYHGLKVCETSTLLWGELLVNRATACAHHGYYIDAIKAGATFIESAKLLPSKAESWLPYAHHAVGLAYHGSGELHKAVEHYHAAAQGYTAPELRAVALTDLAYDLALVGDPSRGRQALEQVDAAVLAGKGLFAYRGTEAKLFFLLGQHDAALASSLLAQEVARGYEDEWAVPLAEVNLTLSKIYWAMGNRYMAGAWGLHAAYHASMKHEHRLADEADAWLAEILDQGGIANDA